MTKKTIVRGTGALGSERPRGYKLISAVALLTLVIFTVDLQVPLGVAGGVPYIAVVLLALWLPDPSHVIRVAWICSALTLAGLAFSPAGGELWKVLANRGLALFAIWTATFLSLGRLAMLNELQLSEQRALRAKLRHANKMGTIGQLTAGAAHDFNNLLTVISGRGQMLLQTLRGQGRAEEVADVRQILQSAESATAFTRQLLTLSRDEEVRIAALSPREVTAGVEGLLRRLLPEDIRIQVKLGESTGNVLADRTQIEQILLNLVVNARDAMDGGGRLIIAVEDVEVDVDRSPQLPEGLSPGAYVRISVSDSGVGMDGATASKMFDPFFTTKGTGTGLGLAIVSGIVDEVGGIAHVQSAPGEGTTVHVYLPRVESAVATSEAADILPAERAAPLGTILVVEDSTGVRQLMVDILRREGHTVLEARDGVEALRVLESHTSAPDLVVTDVVMPRMRGPALVQQLRERRPDLKVLYVSGHSSERISDLGLVPDLTEFLPKPFEHVDLLGRVGSLLLVDRSTRGGLREKSVTR